MVLHQDVCACSAVSLGCGSVPCHVNPSAEFISEVHQSMYRAIEDSLHVEDIRHEINGLRSAHYSDIQQSCSMNVDDLSFVAFSPHASPAAAATPARRGTAAAYARMESPLPPIVSFLAPAPLVCLPSFFWSFLLQSAKPF